MKLQFRGWRRQVTAHNHEVVPVTCSGNYQAGEFGDPLTWNSALDAFGKVDDLALSGSFLVQFSFEQDELRNWLQTFVQSKPEAAIRLLAEMQGEAILALAQRTEAHAIEGSSRVASSPGKASDPPRGGSD